MNVAVCVVTFEAGPLATAYVRETGLSWPLLLDENRELYKAYGMERGRAWKIFGPASLVEYGKLMLRGRIPKPSNADLYQLGGDVLIDPDGTVQFQHVGSGPADRPPVAKLLDVVRSRANNN